MTAGNKCQAMRLAMQSRLSSDSRTSQLGQKQQQGGGGCKDYISLNKNQNLARRRKSSQPLYYVYTRFGDRKRVPDEELRRSKMRRRTRGRPGSRTSNHDYDRRNTDGPGTRRILEPVPQMQRQDVINGLKTNWRSLQTEYQKLPIINDTRWRQQKKEGLEKRLGQLEHDIELMEICRHLFTERTQGTPRRLPPLEAQGQPRDSRQPNEQRQIPDRRPSDPRQSIDPRQSYDQEQPINQRQSLDQRKSNDQSYNGLLDNQRQSLEQDKPRDQRRSLDQRQSIDQKTLRDQRQSNNQRQGPDQVQPEGNDPGEHRNSSTANKVQWLDKWHDFY